MYEADGIKVRQDDGTIHIIVFTGINSSIEESEETAEFLAMCLNQRERDNE